MGLCQHQAWFSQVIATRLYLWDLPNGKLGNDFLDTLNDLFKDVLARKCNMEMPLLFIACILHKERGVSGYPRIKATIDIRQDLWRKGKIDMLVQSVLDAYAVNGAGGGSPRDDLDSKARAYQQMVDKGQLSKAVRNLTSRQKGGILKPGDRDEKSGEFVITVLQQKHPNARVPEDCDFDDFLETSEASDPFPLLFFEEDVESSASSLSGGPGPGGLDGDSLMNWLLRRGTRSSRLRETMAQFAELLANGSPDYALYRAATITRLVALDKEPGVRPVGIGDIFMRLWSHVVHAATKPAAVSVRVSKLTSMLSVKSSLNPTVG